MDGDHVLESFVARIWLERGSNGNSMWRGHIQHVQGEEEAYFQDFGGMNAFLEKVSGVPGPGQKGRRGEDSVVSEIGAAARGEPKK